MSYIKDSLRRVGYTDYVALPVYVHKVPSEWPAYIATYNLTESKKIIWKAGHWADCPQAGTAGTYDQVRTEDALSLYNYLFVNDEVQRRKKRLNLIGVIPGYDTYHRLVFSLGDKLIINRNMITPMFNLKFRRISWHEAYGAENIVEKMIQCANAITEGQTY